MATKKTLLQQAQELNEKWEYQAVIDLLPDTVLQAENSADLYAEKAQAYWRLGKKDLCGEMADKALAIDADNAKANHYKGNVYNDLKEYGRAIACYKRAIAANPKYEYPYNGLGVVYDYKGEYDAAIGWYQKAIELNPRDEDPYNSLGNVYSKRGEYEAAIGQYQKAIELNPKFEYPYNGLGYVYDEKGDYNTAIGWYQKAIELNPQYESPYNGLGIVCMNKGDYDAAIVWYQKVIDLNPKFGSAYYNRALTYEALGDNAKALTDYERYIELRKDNADYYTVRAGERVDKLKKAIENVQYDSVADLVDKIKKLLLFSNGNITHYTGLSTAKALVLGSKLDKETEYKPSPFRLSEGAFLNDTSEGRELFTYLEFLVKVSTGHDTEALSFAAKPFIGSFVAETKHDDLTLWRMYGKEDKEEAKGCAITIDPAKLVEAIQKKLMPSGEVGNLPKMGDDFRLYRVAYKIPKGDFVLPGLADGSLEKELNETLQKLAAKVKETDTDASTTDEDKQNILARINEIAYLFKTAEYQHEQEVRLVLDGVGFEKQLNINATPPRVYIELVNIRSLIQKITIGPKVERGDEWAAAFYYSLDKDGLRPEICISHLPYK